MVTRAWDAGARAGLSLVELMAAVVVFGVGVLGVAASLSHVTALLGSAAARETAVGLAAQLLDSLALAPDPAPGSLEHGRHVLSWSVEPRGGAAAVTLEVVYHDGAAERRVRFRMIHFHAPGPSGFHPPDGAAANEDGGAESASGGSGGAP